MFLYVVIYLLLSSYVVLSQKNFGLKDKGSSTGSKGTTNTQSTTSSPNSCSRHRKPWHQLTEYERGLYISGFLQLSNNGIMAKFTEQHADNTAQQQAHFTAAFLPWHRYFLWEIESQFRSLGPEYECFAIPYWYNSFISFFIFVFIYKILKQN